MALDAARLIQQLPDPQPSTWAYSRPVVILDAFWNLAFVIVTAITLFISQARNERPPAPLSIWLLGYAVQCAVHVICVLLEHERRESRRVREQREQRRGRRRGRGRGRGGRRARGERRGRERGREIERGSGGANGGDGSVNGERGGAGEAAGDGVVLVDQSGERGRISGSGDVGGNVEMAGNRSEREREEEFISTLRRRDAGRVVTLDEAASVLITGRALILEREEEAREGLLGEDGRVGAEARRVERRVVGEEGSTVEDEAMMVGNGVDENESDDSDQSQHYTMLSCSLALVLAHALSCLPLAHPPTLFQPGKPHRVSQHNVLLRLVAQAQLLSCSLMPTSSPLTFSSLARRVESANTMFSFAWWLVGFTWILSTIDDSFKVAPILSWATTAFLAFDVFFVVFCVAVACVVDMALTPLHPPIPACYHIRATTAFLAFDVFFVVFCVAVACVVDMALTPLHPPIPACYHIRATTAFLAFDVFFVVFCVAVACVVDMALTPLHPPIPACYHIRATTAFLAFDVFFVVFCVAVACVVGMAVCCCLPCIIALIYAVADQASAASS
ncbi:unnamed protein product [Closterium sp. Naga37s-1]|nr:unnamed protein product [Closterium sp. Naga37s-1]